MLKLVGFDLDGTLTDTMPLGVAAIRQAALPFTGRPLTYEEIATAFGLSEPGMLEKLVPGHGAEALPGFFAAYEELHSLVQAPFDGVLDLLADLKNRGIILILITGKCHETMEITARRLGLAPYFDRMYSGHPTQPIKAQCMRDALERFHVRPEEAFYVGDALRDITDSQEVGIPCLSAAWDKGVDPQAQLDLKPHKQFFTIENLRAYLEEQA